MRQRIAILIIAGIVVVVSAVFVMQRDRTITAAVRSQPPATTVVTKQSTTPVSPMVAEPATAAQASATIPTDSAVNRDTAPHFVADASGKLVIDEQTRLAIEALIARTDPDKLEEA